MEFICRERNKNLAWKSSFTQISFHGTKLLYNFSKKKKNLREIYFLLIHRITRNGKRAMIPPFYPKRLQTRKTLKRLKRDFPPFLLIAQISHILQKSMQNQREFSKIPKSPRRGIKKKLRTRVLSRRSIRTVVKSRPSSIQNWTK